MDTEHNKNEALPWEDAEKPRKKIKIKPSLVILVCIISLIALISLGMLFAFSLVAYTTADVGDIPQVVSVEQVDNYPVSQLEIDDDILKCNYDDRLELDFSNIGYIYKVTLSNGKEILMHPGSNNHDIGSASAFLELNGYIYLNEKGKITKTDKGTVDTVVSAKIRNSKGKYDPIISESTFEFERKIVDRIVKNIEYKGKAPVEIYKDNDCVIIESDEFEITYGDGKKVTAKPEISENGMYQTLDGHSVDFFEYDDNEDGIDEGIGVILLDSDEYCKIKTKEKDFPFSAVELTACTFDENYRITSLSYTVTYKDGTTAEFNNQKSVSDAERHWVLRYGSDFSFPHNKGYYVIAEPTFVYGANDIPEGADEYEFSGKAAINVELSLGFISEEELKTNKVFAAPESDCDCLCHNNSITQKRIYEIMRPVLEILSLKQFCKCGIYHYEISSF